MCGANWPVWNDGARQWLGGVVSAVAVERAEACPFVESCGRGVLFVDINYLYCTSSSENAFWISIFPSPFRKWSGWRNSISIAGLDAPESDAGFVMLDRHFIPVGGFVGSICTQISLTLRIADEEYFPSDIGAVLKLIRLNTPLYFALEEEVDLSEYLDNEMEYYSSGISILSETRIYIEKHKERLMDERLWFVCYGVCCKPLVITDLLTERKSMAYLLILYITFYNLNSPWIDESPKAILKYPPCFHLRRRSPFCQDANFLWLLHSAQ